MNSQRYGPFGGTNGGTVPLHWMPMKFISAAKTAGGRQGVILTDGCGEKIPQKVLYMPAGGQQRGGQQEWWEYAGNGGTSTLAEHSGKQTIIYLFF